MSRRPAAAAVIALLAAHTAAAQAPAADTALRVTFGGFVDAYYAYDVGRPAALDRAFAGGAPFTTQPARHNEFNVNLAYVEALLAGPRLRGRLALQAGTSVQANYAGEPARGQFSGPLLARALQEAYAGYEVAPALWVDAGVFYSHMGLESWASKDNLTYTRSLVAEYSPYYSSGVRAGWQATPRLAARLDVVNGWQNISETNSGKGVGARLDYALDPGATLSYYAFVNGEAGGRRRLFNGAGARVARGRTTLLAQVDAGRLGAPRAGGAAAASWYGLTLVARRQLTAAAALAARFERYDDPDQVNVATGLADPFRGNGASLGLDVAPHPRLLWRTEARGFAAGARVFPDGDAGARRGSGVAVSSLALAF